MDETCIAIGGKWHYLYRAVDKQGKTVDFLLRPDRGIAAAQSYFRKALASTLPRVPRKVTIDGHVPSRRALWLLRREHPCRRNVTVRTTQVPQQRHRAGPPSHQAALRFDGRVQIIRQRSGHPGGYRTGTPRSQAAILVRAWASAAQLSLNRLWDLALAQGKRDGTGLSGWPDDPGCTRTGLLLHG